MTTLSYTMGEYSVQSSLDLFCKTSLGLELPSWFTWVYGTTPPRSLNFGYPEQPLNFPSFGVTHLGDVGEDYFQGDRADGTYKGIRRAAMMEINCWESSKNNPAWSQHLRQMSDMVHKLFRNNRTVDMYNFSNPSSPSKLTALIRIERIREVDTVPDPNPSVKRKRVLVTYSWIERF